MPAPRPPLPASEVIRGLPPDGGPDFNRLVHEASPYLLQHARNPVDWHPWSAEAFEKARREDKPVFLSVGYSSCHWCHVMEHESFENPAIADVLNRHFVSVKVDREERPDLDDYHMAVTQLMTGRGGWPNSVWLLPDGRPWYAGTYFPPDDRGGRVGFRTLLERLAEVWRERRGDVEEQARQLADAIRQRTEGEIAPGPGPTLDALIERACSAWKQAYDPQHGGFGAAPKFPPHSALELLLTLTAVTSNAALRDMALRTLDAIMMGGIRDHVGGGFHRYATDVRWLVPHFEKMLYDNAQLARVYALAHNVTARPDYLEVARTTLDWVLREMTGPEGAFYSALDADSDGEEGRFYVWSHAEIMQVLGVDDGALYCRVYGIEPGGNFREEATGHPTGLNIPHLAAPAQHKHAKQLADCHQRLLAARAARARPGLDDKRLTAWNGLMIEAFARAAQELKDDDYVTPAIKAASFLLANSVEGGEVMRVWRAGQARIPGFLEDYAALINGLLALAPASGDDSWVTEADTLGRAMLDRFADPLTGMLWPTSARHERLPARTPDVFDQALPSSTSLAVRALHSLAVHTKNPAYRVAAHRAATAALPRAARYPAGCAALLLAAFELERDKPASGASLDLRPAFAAAKRSARVRIQVNLDLPGGWHLQRDDQGHLYRLQLKGDATVVSQGDDHFVIRLAEDASGDVIPVDVSLTITACNDTSCLPPETFNRSLWFDPRADEPGMEPFDRPS